MEEQQDYRDDGLILKPLPWVFVSMINAVPANHMHLPPPNQYLQISGF
jgi:hypothetical protein